MEKNLSIDEIIRRFDSLLKFQLIMRIYKVNKNKEFKSKEIIEKFLLDHNLDIDEAIEMAFEKIDELI